MRQNVVTSENLLPCRGIEWTTSLLGLERITERQLRVPPFPFLPRFSELGMSVTLDRIWIRFERAQLFTIHPEFDSFTAVCLLCRMKSDEASRATYTTQRLRTWLL